MKKCRFCKWFEAKTTEEATAEGFDWNFGYCSAMCSWVVKNLEPSCYQE